MPADHIPKKPIGYVPGKDFVSNNGDPYGLKLGLITRVDEFNMKADVKVLTGGGDRFEIDLTQGMSGPRSFWGGVPEVNSIVILGYRRRSKQLYEAMILGYVPTGNKLGNRFDPFSPADPSSIDPADAVDFKAIFGNGYRVKRLRLRPGDVGGMSAAGAEFALSKDVRMSNHAGDLFELRATDRTLISQAIHRVQNESGVTTLSGPVRRGIYFTYPDILQSDGKTLKDSSGRYFGRSVYQSAGPGFSGSPNRFADANGVLLDVFNNTNEFPPVTYSNGRRVHYPATTPAVNIEDPDTGAGAEVFVEERQQLDHTSDLTQQVLDEIDGFQIDRRRPYIERVLGTTVGNDTSSSEGQRTYGRVTKPHIFDDFVGTSSGSFSMMEVPRSPTDDLEVFTTAGAFFLGIHPPRSTDDNYFAAAVSKQGKVFLNIPGSSFERYPSGTKNVSVEAMLAGALKMHIGAASPSNVSINLTCVGGIVADIGSNQDGRAIEVRYHSSVQTTYHGVPDTDNVAITEDVQGVKQAFCSSDSIQNVGGAKVTTVNGGYQIHTDRMNINANNGYSLNAQDYSTTIAGKSQYNYSLQVLENIQAGGKVSTILAGGFVQTVSAGAIATTAAAGAMTDTVGAAYSLSAGAAVSVSAGGAISQTATGAITQSAGAAMSAVSTLAMSFTAGVAVNLVAPQMLFGGPAAIFGVARGTPNMPPGSPSLDWITGLPLMGCAVTRSL